jgi:hypothetical protein
MRHETIFYGAVEELITAAGGKLIAMFGRAARGPGAMVIFDVPDPAMAPAMCGVPVSSGYIQNIELTRLFSNGGNCRHSAKGAADPQRL